MNLKKAMRSSSFHENDAPTMHLQLNTCHAQRLADVELQLVFQCLSNIERVTSARVSRQFLRAARSPFAWKVAEPYMLSTRRTACFPLVARSLLSLAPIHLGWET